MNADLRWRILELRETVDELREELESLIHPPRIAEPDQQRVFVTRRGREAVMDGTFTRCQLRLVGSLYPVAWEVRDGAFVGQVSIPVQGAMPYMALTHGTLEAPAPDPWNRVVYAVVVFWPEILLEGEEFSAKVTITLRLEG